MDIRKIYEQFAVSLTRIELYQRTALKTSQQELVNLLSTDKYRENWWPALKTFPASAHNMYFRHVRTGDEYVLGGTVSSLEELQLDVTIRRNKQYQWLLAEAYEELEDLLEYVYAFCGHRNPEIWQLPDFGNISMSEIQDKNYDWHLHRAREKKGRPYSILKQIRKNYPDLDLIELQNPINVNFKFTIIFIEKLRHFIVHKGGIVVEIEEFIKDVLSDAGIAYKGEKAKSATDFIRNFFRPIGSGFTIFLVEPKVFVGMPFYADQGSFGKLFGYLASYGNLICETVGLHVTSDQRVNGEAVPKSETTSFQPDQL